MARKNGKKGGKRSPRRSVSDVDVESVRSSASLRAAAVAGLTTDLMAPEEIPSSLQALAPELSHALTTFLDALDAWHELHNDLLDHEPPLAQEEQAHLFRLIRAKEEARARFAALTEIPAPEVARTWISQSLQPVQDQLALEIPRLESRRFAWRFHLNESELLFPVAGHAGPVLRSSSLIVAPFKELVEQHDKLLEGLFARLREASGTLLQVVAFKAAVTNAVDEHEKNHAGDRPWGAFPKDRIYPLCAEYVLNGVVDVVAGTTTMETFWNENGERIRGAAPQATMEPVHKVATELLVHARQLQGITEALVDRLSKLCGVIVTPRTASPWYPERF